MTGKLIATFDIVLRDGDDNEFTIKAFTRTAFIYGNAWIYRLNTESAREAIENAKSCNPILHNTSKMLKCIRISGQIPPNHNPIDRYDSLRILYSDEVFDLYFIQGLYNDFIDVVCSKDDNGLRKVISVLSDIHTITEVHRVIQLL